MKATRNTLAALAGAVALAMSLPALSQGMNQDQRGRPNDQHQPGPRANDGMGHMDNRDMHGGDMNHGNMQDMHRNMHSGDRMEHRNNGWRGHRRHCHWSWRHHHRVRVCSRW